MKKVLNVILAIIVFLFIGYIVGGCYDKNDLDEAYNSGYESGYSEASSGAYDEGYYKGYEEGHTDGRREGLDEGYGEGYHDGYNAAYDKFDLWSAEDAIQYFIDNQNLNDLIGALFDRLGVDEMYQALEEYQ